MKQLVALLLMAGAQVSAQEILSDRIVGLRVNGSALAGVPASYQSQQPVTIEFDVNDANPEEFVVKFLHCDKDWSVTKNGFINNETKNFTKDRIPYQQAPPGVKGYTFTYSLRAPGFAGIESFEYSGNYIFEIWDKEISHLLGRGRMFVAEKRTSAAMSVANRLLPSSSFPENQVNLIDVAVTVKDDSLSDPGRVIPSMIKTVDIYTNRELGNRVRIDLDDRDPHTFIEGYMLDRETFSADNVSPGNEYRRIDLRSIDFYPLGTEVRPRGGADVVRYLHQGARDNDGRSTVTSGDRFADYLDFSFELVRDAPFDREVFVLGDFNGWRVDPKWKMTYDNESKRYFAKARLRRGVYDYEYSFEDGDRLMLEGNDWRTINIYSAFVYYHDFRLGGFDRIIGFVQGRSPGGSEATSR